MARDILKVIGENVKKYRQEKGVTQLKLSILTNISKDYITAIECGKRTPSFKRLAKIANALDIEAYRFLQ